MNMLVVALFLFVLALAAGADRFGWVTGKPVINAGYFGGIITVLLLIFLFCAGLTWKLACPGSEKWMSYDCFKAANFGWMSF